jgi:transposase
MAKFKKYEIGSVHSVVIDLAHYLPEDHLCKHIEKIVSNLDTSLIEAEYSELGQNALHPKLMLSVIFYGYTVGMRTGRKLAKACEEQLPFIYLSKSYRPQKSCINDFRKNNYLHFADLFVQVLSKCQESGLGDASFSIVDGSKEEANSSKRRTKTKEQYEKWQQTLLADIASLEQELSNQESKKKARS